MKFTRISQISGKITSREIDVTEEQLLAWENGGMIHKVMPNISASDREFLMTGITEEEWEREFGDDPPVIP